MSADIAAPLPHEWKPGVNPRLIAMSIMLATIMEVLDTSVANVSLPFIAGNLSASTDEATWVLTSYLVSNAIILPATNWLGQLFGRKRFLISCIIISTLASALCGLAGSLGFLIMARVLQGAVGGALQPISQAVLMESFPQQKRGMAMAVFTMGIVVAPILGPTIGGWLTYNYSWRWVFYINLPIGILATVLTKAFLEDLPYLKRVSASNIDYLGFGFLGVWLASLQIMLDKSQELDWFSSKMIVWCAVLSTVGFIGFIVRELLARFPLVDLRILKNRNFAVGNRLRTTEEKSSNEHGNFTERSTHDCGLERERSFIAQILRVERANESRRPGTIEAGFGSTERKPRSENETTRCRNCGRGFYRRFRLLAARPKF